MSITGIILAGGQSRRFGTPKALAKYNNKPLYEYSFEALQEVTEEIITISIPQLKQYLQKGNRIIIEDLEEVKGKGPLAGLYTGMKARQSEWYVILPCDMPLVNGEMIKKLVAARDESVDAIIPKVDGKVQPLVGLYHSRTKGIIKSFLKEDHLRMMSLLEQLHVIYLDEYDLQLRNNIFQNINYRTDLEDN